MVYLELLAQGHSAPHGSRFERRECVVEYFAKREIAIAYPLHPALVEHRNGCSSEHVGVENITPAVDERFGEILDLGSASATQLCAERRLRLDHLQALALHVG